MELKSSGVFDVHKYKIRNDNVVSNYDSYRNLIDFFENFIVILKQIIIVFVYKQNLKVPSTKLTHFFYLKRKNFGSLKTIQKSGQVIHQ